MQQAIRAGAAETIVRNYRGELAECAQSNRFIVSCRSSRSHGWAGPVKKRLLAEYQRRVERLTA